MNNILITASIDQRITLWKWSYTEGVFEILYEDQRIVAVPDIQGMDAKWCSSDKILVAIHGKGIQTLKVDVG